MLCSLSIFADDVTPGITVNKTDGSAISFATAEMYSIKFAEGNMIVNMKDCSQQSVALDDITNIIFEDISTAIKALTNSGSDNGFVTITDLSGRIVYNGKAETRKALPNGIYVVTVNGKSCKVIIK